MFDVLKSLPPYRSAADLLLQIGREEILSDWRGMQPDKLRRCGWTLALAQFVLPRLPARRNHIRRLPVEVLRIIFDFAWDYKRGSDVGHVLSAVSQAWRSIVMGQASLWETVVLRTKTQKKAMAKMDLFASRATTRELCVYLDVPGTRSHLINALSARIANLDDLVLACPFFTLVQVWKLVRHCPTLKGLVMILPEDSKVTNSRPPHAFPSIRYLEFQRPWSTQPRSPLRLDRICPFFPGLETLVVEDSDVSLVGKNGPDFTVPSLQALVVVRVHDFTESSSARIVLPSLRSLDLSRSKTSSCLPYLFPSSEPPNTQHLTHLLLSEYPGEGERALLDHLADLVALVRLDVRGNFPAPHALIQALIHPAIDNSGPKFCPALERLDVNGEVIGSNLDEPYKRYKELIEQRESARELAASRPNVSFVIVGWNGIEGFYHWSYETAIAVGGVV